MSPGRKINTGNDEKNNILIITDKISDSTNATLAHTTNVTEYN